MAEIVAAALTAHAPLITGKPDVAKPEQRDRLDRPARGGARLEGRAARLRAGGRVDHRLRHRLGAPVIPVSYALNKLLTAIARRHQMREGLTDEDMSGHELSEPERAALRSGDIGRLYELGAN
ncbi:MAG: hypothetical protein ACREKJ_04655, partial [Candidatus Rokuibacteriota bacterium]